jgi:hypothetical protein
MNLVVYKALAADSQLEQWQRLSSDEFQFQGRWAYYSSNSTINPTLGNAAPPENRFWRYSYTRREFYFVTIGKYTDNTPDVDLCATLYGANPTPRGLDPQGPNSEGNGFIWRASAFFWRAQMQWSSERNYPGRTYEP